MSFPPNHFIINTIILPSIRPNWTLKDIEKQDPAIFPEAFLCAFLGAAESLRKVVDSEVQLSTYWLRAKW
jgi:hypothetical protein